MHNNTFSFSDNYYLRKCYLEKNEVPTQSVMKKTMSPPLAQIYFNSMTPKLKVLAGLEPPLKGAGENWYVPPKELLQERIVLKPFEKEYMSKWNCYGVDEFGMKLANDYRKQLKALRKSIAYAYDKEWSNKLKATICEHEAEASVTAANSNTEYIKSIVREFEQLYSTSTTKMEGLLFDAAKKIIEKYQEAVLEKMQARYKILLQKQAPMLYDKYDKKLDKEKEFYKQQFIEELDVRRAEFQNKLHDINVEKHVAVEKLRHFLECQTLACQVYVAMKEREKCNKEIELSKEKHNKQIKTYSDKVMRTAHKLDLAKEKENKLKQFDLIWKKKICFVLKALQSFVSYCLKELPDYAEFFINLEKLMLLQVSEALEAPTVESIIQQEQSPTVKAKPRPYYLFCNRGSHTTVDTNMCPKHVTSSASQIPAIVINKRCIYAACDNFEQFTDTIKDYVHGALNNDVEDDYDYTRHVNVTYTLSEQLRELKLQSSLMQVLQQEIGNLRKVPIECGACKIPHCFDCFFGPNHATLSSPESSKFKETIKKATTRSISKMTSNKILKCSDLEHVREPNWDSYLKYIEPKKCICGKLAKKHLREHLPVYMRTMPTYDAPELNKYEACSASTIKALAKSANQPKIDATPVQSRVPTKTIEISVQCSDYQIDCRCFSDISAEFSEDIVDIIKRDESLSRARVLQSTSYMKKSPKSFASASALSLRQLIAQTPELEEIFKNRNCMYDE